MFSTFLVLFLFVAGCGQIPVYMINSDTEQEPGFQQVCWSDSGHAIYRNLSCSNPEEVVWRRNQIPLIVSSMRELTVERAACDLRDKDLIFFPITKIGAIAKGISAKEIKVSLKLVKNKKIIPPIKYMEWI